MSWMEALKEKFIDRLSPATLRSPLLWKTAEGLARSPLNRPAWRADAVALRYFLQQTARAYRGEGPVVWASLLFPSELIHAAGAVPFYPEMAAAVISSLDLAPRFLDAAAHAGFSSDTCSFHRVILGAWMEGFMPEPACLAAADYLCDSAPLSFRAVSLRGKKPLALAEVPFRSEGRKVETLGSCLEEAARRIASACGVGWDRYLEGLEGAVELSNRARLQLREVEELRREHPLLLDGRDALGHLSMLASSFGHPAGERFYGELAAETDGDAATDGVKRLLWMHLKPYYPHHLFDHLERHGGRIVCEEYNRCYWEEMDPLRPFASLARKLAGHFGVGSGERRARAMRELALSYRVDGAVHFNHWGCRQSAGGAALVREALKKEGIPVLLLEGDCIDGREYQEGQVSTRLEAFLEAL
jgi:benzoyl-CoA reductase/2-hydroxyglutaryl-CoA dehydratase subunit BcrC/BadD/HgdB